MKLIDNFWSLKKCSTKALLSFADTLTAFLEKLQASYKVDTAPGWAQTLALCGFSGVCR